MTLPGDDRSRTEHQYERLKRAVAGERLPCALVLIDEFDANVDRCVAVARTHGKRLRVATKSLRVPALIRRVLERGDAGVRRGLMAYAVTEAAWLAEQGFDDLLVAYPSVQPCDLAALAEATAAGRPIRLVVDSVAHLEALARSGRERGTTCRAVVELDVSYRALGGALHLGPRRSPLRTPEDVVGPFRAASALEGVAIDGIMAYEAHVAGVPDTGPSAPGLAGPVRRLFKRFAVPAAAALRTRAVAAVRAAGFRVDLVNGGGTGSLETTAADPSVTEVTAGSAFLAPHLFDGYRGGPAWRPACFFACQVVRASDPGYVTCHGGGYAASGAAGKDRLPRPWLPAGLSLVDGEGAGEVQTPLRTDGCAVPLAPGDPVFFRHAKAGELAEHYDEYLLVAGDGRVVDRARTYRGHGCCFV